MKNYTQVSRLVDCIIERIMTLKVLSTDPTNPDWIRESAYKKLVEAYKNIPFMD